jgi:hypothetical protein
MNRGYCMRLWDRLRESRSSTGSMVDMRDTRRGDELWSRPPVVLESHVGSFAIR